MLGVSTSVEAGAGATSDLAHELMLALEVDGWAAIRSAALDEVVVIVDRAAPIPDEYAAAVRYTVEEVRLLVGVDRHSLAVLNEFKRAGAVVVARELVGANDPQRSESSPPGGSSRPVLVDGGRAAQVNRES